MIDKYQVEPGSIWQDAPDYGYVMVEWAKEQGYRPLTLWGSEKGYSVGDWPEDIFLFKDDPFEIVHWEDGKISCSRFANREERDAAMDEIGMRWLLANNSWIVPFGIGNVFSVEALPTDFRGEYKGEEEHA